MICVNNDELSLLPVFLVMSTSDLRLSREKYIVTKRWLQLLINNDHSDVGFFHLHHLRITMSRATIKISTIITRGRRVVVNIAIKMAT